MPQNWNNVLSYVKAHLGSKLQNIEIEDNEFILFFKDHTLSEFSLVEPYKSWVIIRKVNSNHLGGTEYRFDLNENENILDVHKIYYGRRTHDLANTMFVDPRDVVMSNTLRTMLDFLRTETTFQFIKPNIVLLSSVLDTDAVIAEVNLEHNEPSSIPSDLYRTYFLKLCLVDAIQLILGNRIKYSNLSSPFGEINLNIDYLQNKLENLKREIEEIETWMPHREYLEII